MFLSVGGINALHSIAAPIITITGMLNNIPIITGTGAINMINIHLKKLI